MVLQAIDLFCGIGGLTYGLRKAGIEVLAGLDSDKSCKYSYEKNNNAKFIEADIGQQKFLNLKSLYSSNAIKILVGCAPCQPFSAHSNKSKNRSTDKRWNLVEHFLRAVEVMEPQIVSMENVRGLMKTDVYLNFVSGIKALGYYVNAEIVYCPDYGIPQSRSRMVLLASKLSDIELPQKTHSKNKYLTVKDKIGGLPSLQAGQKDLVDEMHRCKNLEALNLKRIRQSSPNGTWRDWDKELLPDCYKKDSGKTYSSVYGRMSWDNVAPTITTQFYNYGSGRFGHPEQDRAISLREGALLQTFPKSYDFGKQISHTKTGRHIGNAVPPRLGYVIGKQILRHVGK